MSRTRRWTAALLPSPSGVAGERGRITCILALSERAPGVTDSKTSGSVARFWTLAALFIDRPNKWTLRHVRLTVDSDGNPVVEPVNGEAVSLSPEGSIDQVKVSLDRFYHCGCTAQEPMGGQCGEPGCLRVSCNRCFGRCSRCQKPTCLECARYLDIGKTQPIRLCHACHDARIRGHRLQTLVRHIFSPFVRFDEGQDKR